MKKVFKLTQPNKHPERVLDAIKYDIRRYLKRERKKALPGNSAFWEFECKLGKTSSTAEGINTSEIISAVEKAKSEGWDEFYIEILAKPSAKQKKKTDDDTAS